MQKPTQNNKPNQSKSQTKNPKQTNKKKNKNPVDQSASLLASQSVNQDFTTCFKYPEMCTYPSVLRPLRILFIFDLKIWTV